MATIALYAGKMNQMTSLIGEVKKSVDDYSSELFSLKLKAVNIRKSVCNLDDVIGMVQTSTQIQEQKAESLETFSQKTEEFTAEVVRIDEEAAAVINQSKEDFYNKYNYLKPDAEKNFLEEWFDDAAAWCAEHWQEIVTTAAIIVGAALAIAAVVITGGAALVPLLSTLLTAAGVSAGAAMTAATIISFTVAVIAVGSTIGSSVLNIVDTWGNIDDPTFNAWQSALNWTSMISNGLYSIGSIYNGIKGIENGALRKFGKSWREDSNFRNAIGGADKFPFSIQPNTSTFWSGIGDKGMNNGDLIAANCADKMGRSTLETTLASHKINMPQWNLSDPSTIRAWQSASSSYAMHSSGNVAALLGNNVRPTSVWNVFEKIILNVNPGVSSITTYTTTGVNIYERTIQWGSVLLGGTNAFGQAASVVNGDD